MHTLYTIGYGGRTPEQVAEKLREHGVEVLVDVRAVPRTRIPGFNKVQLTRYLTDQGIAYQHVEALGNLNRKAGPGAPVVLVDEEAGLDTLQEVLEHRTAAIMCAEKSYLGCHRRDIAEKLQHRVADLTVEHLSW